MTKLLLLFIALLATPLCYGQRTITLYGQMLNAPDILGSQNAVWGPAAAPTTTVLLNNPIVSTELHQLLGTYYSTTNFAKTTDLLNILAADDEPILDKINFSFYRTAFLSTLDNAFSSDAKYRPFKRVFLAATTDAQRRLILFDDDNTVYRKALEQARYTTYGRPEITINAFTSLSRTFKAGLGADITASIKAIPGAKFGAGLNAAINSLIERSVTMNGAHYHEIRLTPTYISKAKTVLSYYAEHPDKIGAQSEFNDNLKRFFALDNVAITAGAAVIESSFKTTDMKQLGLAIGAAAKANLTDPTSAIANKVAADAEAKFTRDSLKKLGVEAGQCFYTIRLVYDCGLELGAGKSAYCKTQE